MSYDSIDPPLADRRIPAGGDFLSAQALAELTPELLVQRMKDLAPQIAAAAPEAERLRRPVDEIWNALRAAGTCCLQSGLRVGVAANYGQGTRDEGNTDL